MIKVITYGTYDLLHQGHINLLRRAKELGDYLIVGVTSDSFDKGRGKLNVRNNVLERVEAVKATGYADEVIIEDYVGQKIDDIQRYDVDIFAIGSDWVGKFDYLNEYCKVIYLPRTEGVSSTQLRAETQSIVRIGIVGSGRIARRFVPEAGVVDGAEVNAVYNPDKTEADWNDGVYQGLVDNHQDVRSALQTSIGTYSINKDGLTEYHNFRAEFGLSFKGGIAYTYKDLKLSTTLALFTPYQGKGFSLKDKYEEDHGPGSWETRDVNANYFAWSNRNRFFGMFDVDWDVALSYQFLKCLQVTLQTSLKYYPGTLIEKDGVMSERVQFKGVIGVGVGYSF